MKQTVLQNPEQSSQPVQVDTEVSGKSNEYQNLEQQLGLELAQTRKQKLQQSFANIWARLVRREAELEIMPFWRETAPAFAVGGTVFTIVALFLVSIANFASFPPQVPFYFNQLEQRWEQADKIFLLITPVVLFVVLTMLLRLIYEIFYIDRRLAVMLSWVTVVLNILIIIAATQIYLLVT